MNKNAVLIHWDNSLNLGIEEIDQQHQTLARLGNDIYRAIQLKKDQAVIDDLLGQLASYIRIHFAVEESLMRTLNYPDYLAHKQSHEALLGECIDIRKQIQTGRMTLSQLLEFLGPWFSDHVLHADKLYADHFHKAGVEKTLQCLNWMSSLWQWHPNP